MLSTQLPVLRGSLGLQVWISPTQQITATDLKKITTSWVVFHFFPMNFLTNILLWQDGRLLSLPSSKAQLQNMRSLHG